MNILLKKNLFLVFQHFLKCQKNVYIYLNFAQNIIMKKSKVDDKNLVFVIFPIVTLTLFFAVLFLVSSQNQWLLSLDLGTALVISSRQSTFWNYFFVAITYLGEAQTIAILCLFLLVLPNRKKIGIPVSIATFASFAISFVTKHIIRRDRPVGFFLKHDVLGYTFSNGYSFPSGHAQTAVVFFLLLAFLLCLDKGLNAQILILSFATTFCALMCFSRLYVGVHYFSDVFAGLMLALSIVSISFFVILQSRKKTVYQ